MADNRIYNVNKISRPVDFSRLPHLTPRRCSPTDQDVPPIQFIVQLGPEKKYLCGDFKEHGKELTVGQKMLLEATVHAFRKDGYKAIAFLAWHPEDVMVIDAASSIVVSATDGYIWQWYDEPRRGTLLQKYLRFFKEEIIDISTARS